MKFTIVLLSIILTLSCFASDEVAPCGQGALDDPSLDWSKALDIKINFTVMQDEAILCLGNIPGTPINVKSVVYRDSTGLEKKFKLYDLEMGTQTIINSDEISFGVIKKGKIMTLQLQRESLGLNYSEGIKYKASLRFLRNLAKVPFDSRDHRILEMDIDQTPTGEFYPIYKGTEFNEIKINISVPSLHIKKIDLNVNGNIERTIVTKKLNEVRDL